MNDIDLIQASKKDARAFEALYNKYFEEVFRFLASRCMDLALCKDLTQDSFIKALKNISKYEERGLPFNAWLKRIAYNEFLQHHRALKKTRKIQANKADVIAMLYDNQHDNSEIEAMIPRLKSAMKMLKEDEIFILEMRYFEGMSFKEISDISELSLSNAKVKAHRVLKKLKNILS